MPDDEKETEPRIPTARSLGCVGYEAYAQSTGGKTFDGRDMPRWTDLPERVVNAWESAAFAIVDEAVMKRDARVIEAVATEPRVRVDP